MHARICRDVTTAASLWPAEHFSVDSQCLGAVYRFRCVASVSVTHRSGIKLRGSLPARGMGHMIRASCHRCCCFEGVLSNFDVGRRRHFLIESVSRHGWRTCHSCTGYGSCAGPLIAISCVAAQAAGVQSRSPKNTVVEVTVNHCFQKFYRILNWNFNLLNSNTLTYKLSRMKIRSCGSLKIL